MLLIRANLKQGTRNWSKKSYVTDTDYDEFNRIIYNNLKTEDHIEEEVLEYSWADDLMVEDEIYNTLTIPGIEHYALTSYARIFNLQRMTTVKIGMRSNRNMFVVLKGINVNIRKQFLEFGWTYVPSLIKEKHEKYGW